MEQTPLPPLMRSVLDLLEKEGPLSPKDIATKLNKSGNTIRQTLYVLKRVGKVQHIGKERSVKGKDRAMWKIAR